MNDTCVLLFVKYPEPGRVKTRLGEVIGNDVAADFYKRFVEDLLKGLATVQAALRICYLPVEGHDVEARLRDWLGNDYAFFPQEGADLGERMKAAMQKAFADGFSRVVLMGSDIPDFPPELVQKALLDLDMKEAVIGPAYDGGYYLIGFRREFFFPEVFDGIVWGEADVFRPTMEHLRRKGLEVLRLPDWNDVDTIWDLNVLYRTNRNSSFRKSATFAKLREHNDIIRQYDLDLPKMPGR
jgi:rSAM/selenodomain-associated transferase 1